jgi:hypothetical protein
MSAFLQVSYRPGRPSRRRSGRRAASKRIRRPLPRFVNQAYFEPASNGTINRELALLRRAFNLGRMATPAKVAATPFIFRCWAGE